MNLSLIDKASVSFHLITSELPSMLGMGFIDFINVFENCGNIYYGIGESNKGLDVATEVLRNLQGKPIQGVKKFIVSVVTKDKDQLKEVRKAMDKLKSVMSNDAHIYYCEGVDSSLNNKIRVLLIAVDKNCDSLKTSGTVSN
jgi:cell division GTPase FtsZ